MKREIALALLSLASACGPPLKCVTTCGLALTDTPWWTCSEFQAVEERVLAEFPHATDPRFDSSCWRIRNFAVAVRAEFVWTGKDGKTPVLGQTWCDEGRITVGHLVPMKSSLAHELAHAVQGCSPLVPAGWTPRVGEDADHAGWEEQGIRAAVSRVLEAK